ncbi:MAG TPA: hypothetical protein VME67_09785 [Mycobacterium sp.]|nr:hypothetical protein [Mycobacterium sp.]HTX95100.1 hypothetical protein [Mycobacterium sp.]
MTEHDPCQVWALRIILSALQEDVTAAELVFDEIAGCPRCLRFVAIYLAQEATLAAAEARGHEPAIHHVAREIDALLALPRADHP